MKFDSLNKLILQTLHLEEFMLYAHGSDLCHDLELRHAMANCFEALMGSLYLDGDIDVNTIFAKYGGFFLIDVYFYRLQTECFLRRFSRGKMCWLRFGSNILGIHSSKKNQRGTDT